MADNLLDMQIFARVAETGSLSAAARDLRLSLAVVSRKLARLEERLGVRLVNRTTRRLSLTEEGAAFEARCLRILADIEEAELEASRGRETATGLLKMTSTIAFGRRQLAPLLHEFKALHPDLRIQLHATDTITDIVQGGFDLAIRFGALSDSSLIARHLAPNHRVICGAPSYLARRGPPVVIEDLFGHDCVVYGDPLMTRWTFADGRSIEVKGSLATNDGELAHQWALDGGGLVLKSIWDVGPDIAAGRLEVVLPEIALPASPIHAVYPHSRHAAAKVRLCVAFLAERLKAPAADRVRGQS